MPTNTITLDEINLLKHSEEIKDINLYRTLYEIICTNGFKNYIRNIRSQNKRVRASLTICMNLCASDQR